jgi:sporulation protein YlmC with PRC-barrel domain
MSGRLMMSTAIALLLTGGALAQDQQQQPAEGQQAEQAQQPAAEGEQQQTEQAQDQPAEGEEQQTEQAQDQPAEGEQQQTEQAQDQPAEGEQQQTEQAQDQPAEGEQQTEQAQDQPAEGEQQTAEASVDFIKMQEEGQQRAQQLIGFDVMTSDDEDVGEVQDLVFDDQNKITAVVLSVGGFLGVGEKSVAVPFDAIQVEEEAVRVNVGSDTLEDAPAFATLEEVKDAEQAQEAQQDMQQQQQEAQEATQPAESQ